MISNQLHVKRGNNEHCSGPGTEHWRPKGYTPGARYTACAPSDDYKEQRTKIFESGPILSEKQCPPGPILPKILLPGPKFLADQNFRDSTKISPCTFVLRNERSLPVWIPYVNTWNIKRRHSQKSHGYSSYGQFVLLNKMAVSSLFVSVVLLTVASTREPPTEKTRETKEYFGKNESIPREIFTASWAVEITEGGQKMADKIARQYGFNNLGEV